MISDLHKVILSVFLVFCRMGSCIMVLPGFSAVCVPIQVRLYLSIASSIALLPFLWDVVYPHVSVSGFPLSLIVIEILIGITYGLFARIYVLGLQFTGTILSTMVGLNVPSGIDIFENTVEMPITIFITVAGLLVLFAMDFHHEIFYALVKSYTVTPLGGEINFRINLISLLDTLRETFFIMLRLASPFLLFGLMFNISIGLFNKLVPQIPLYFISSPYMLGLGFLLLYLTITVILRQFSHSFMPVFLGK